MRGKGADGKERADLYDRCPMATIPQWVWFAVDAAAEYLDGLRGPNFRPSARFADVVSIVAQFRRSEHARQWQSQTSFSK